MHICFSTAVMAPLLLSLILLNSFLQRALSDTEVWEKVRQEEERRQAWARTLLGNKSPLYTQAITSPFSENDTSVDWSNVLSKMKDKSSKQPAAKPDPSAAIYFRPKGTLVVGHSILHVHTQWDLGKYRKFVQSSCLCSSSLNNTIRNLMNTTHNHFPKLRQVTKLSSTVANILWNTIPETQNMCKQIIRQQLHVNQIFDPSAVSPMPMTHPQFFRMASRVPPTLVNSPLSAISPLINL